MSFTIHQGYRLPGMTLDELTAWSDRFAHLARWADLLIRHRAYADMMTSIVDAVALADAKAGLGGQLTDRFGLVAKHFDPSVASAAVDAVDAKRRKASASGYRDPDWDGDCRLHVLPHAGHIYLMLFAEHRLYAWLLKQQPGVAPYPYWDGDPPKGLSEKAWGVRRAEWEGAIGPSGVPAHRGFSVDCTADKWMQWPLERLLTFQPSWARRVRREVMRRLDEIGFAGYTADPTKVWPRMQKRQRWYKTDQGRLAIAREWREVAPRLPQRLTTDTVYLTVDELYCSLH